MKFKGVSFDPQNPESLTLRLENVRDAHSNTAPLGLTSISTQETHIVLFEGISAALMRSDFTSTTSTRQNYFFVSRGPFAGLVVTRHGGSDLDSAMSAGGEIDADNGLLGQEELFLGQPGNPIGGGGNADFVLDYDEPECPPEDVRGCRSIVFVAAQEYQIAGQWPQSMGDEIQEGMQCLIRPVGFFLLFRRMLYNKKKFSSVMHRCNYNSLVVSCMIRS